jgi:hypothetical protein
MSGYQAMMEVRFACDSPLEEAGFELLVPQSIQLGGVNAGCHGGAYPSCLFSTRASYKSSARQCYRFRAATPSAEGPVSFKLNAWSCSRE